MPRKATKVCPDGHRQSTRWKTGDPCLKCQLERLEAERAAEGVAERRRWQEELGPAPAALTIRCGDGSVLTHAIPRARGARRRGRPL